MQMLVAKEIYLGIKIKSTRRLCLLASCFLGLS